MDFERIVEPLILWYDRERRILPWREKISAYKTWVSEIMLQQTRVEAVKPYFLRFMAELPTVKDLANCKEEKLLKLWEGLGYYNRVRNMQKAAIIVVSDYAGVMPQDFDTLKKLPGIGSYTAGAIASIVYGEAVPAVDGNVLRVLARYREDARDIIKASTKSAVEQELLQIIPKQNPGRFNQALMELGALICVPNGKPACEKCPLHSLCGAALHHTISDYPVKTQKKARRIENKTILLIVDGTRVVLEKREQKGLLAGMYEYPVLEGIASREEVLQEVEKHYGLTALRIEKLNESKHIFTHLEWNMTGYMVLVQMPEEKTKQDLLFVEIEDAKEKYSIPTAYKEYSKKLRIRSGYEKAHERKRH